MNVSCKLRGRAALAAAILMAAAAPGAARADCAAPAGYYTRVTGTAVQIAPSIPTGACPGDGLLRVDSATHAAVLITTCGPGWAGGTVYLDECVPPGTYQYGYRTPYACSPHSCGGTYYYGTVTVTEPVEGCQRTVAAPVAYTDPLPWGASDLICESSYGESSYGKGCASGGAPGAGPVLAVNALVLVAGLWLLRRRARAAGAPRA